MAPSNPANGAKAVQQNRLRPTPRHVVPAIPLPYVQKRQQHQAARAKAREVAITPAVVEAPVSLTPPAREPTPDPTPLIVNGSTREQTPESIEDVRGELTSANDSTPAVATAEELPEKLVEEDSVIAPREESSEGPIEIPTPSHSEIHSDGRSSASRSTYHMPPDFVPANSQSSGMNSESVKLPPQHGVNDGNSMHHPHPSSGSVMFGSYAESNNSSPAPPPSGGNMPPPPFGFHPPPQGPPRHITHQSNGGHSLHLSNGFNHLGPPPPPGYYARQEGYWPGNDNLNRRQMVSFGEGYSPSGTPVDNQRPYDPATPHSLHGSQSSHQDQENGPPFYSQYPTAVINGNNGHIDNVRLYQPPRANKPQSHGPFMNHPPPVQFPLIPDNYDGLIGYLQMQFADPVLADWNLELRYSDDRATPVRIPGHNLMFARSPLLKEKMLAQSSEGLTSRTLLIESDDRFLRSDSFWMAMQRLYGAELLDIGTSPERFDLGLGYAAAGHLLGIPSVVNRGIDIASQFITWNTLEKALDFGLDGGLDSQWTLTPPGQQERHPATYGPAVNMIIHSALNFIINNFPSTDFHIDASASEPARNRRLPAVPELRPSSQNPRLSHIKFGDHSTDSDSSRSASDSLVAILSKVLLNLPFPLLKYVMESRNLGYASGLFSTPLRHQILLEIIEEREKRRIKVHNSHVSNAERAANAKEWEAVGYRESLESVGTNETSPTLSRVWVDFNTSTS